jgi:hypothetical protein
LPDRDGDGVPDDNDNCPDHADADQTDSDADGRGNACDNCPAAANTLQSDGDADAVGDVCDNCAQLRNPSQADSDRDGRGDVCDGSVVAGGDSDTDDDVPPADDPDAGNNPPTDDPAEQEVPVPVLTITAGDADGPVLSEWQDAPLHVEYTATDGTVTDVTESENLAWSSTCGGAFDGGFFIPPSVNQSLPCDLTATLTLESGDVVSQTVHVVIGFDRCRKTNACGTDCGCTPGSAFGLITGFGLLLMRFASRRGRGRPGRL